MSTSDEEWFRLRNHDPRKYEGRVNHAATVTSEDIRKRYNRGRYWIITTDEGELPDEHERQRAEG